MSNAKVPVRSGPPLPPRHSKSLLCCSIIATLISTLCFVSGAELRLGTASQLSFFPREGRQHFKTTRGRGMQQQQLQQDSRTSVLSSVLLDLRCGGDDEQEPNDIDDEEAAVAAESNSDEKYPVVDISRADGDDDSLMDDVDNGDIEVFEMAPSDDESDMSSDDDYDDVLNNANNHDLVDSTTEEEEASSDDDAFKEGSNLDSNVESARETDTDNIIMTQEALISSASIRRAEGKSLHDAGTLEGAATAFREAALLLDDALLKTTTEDAASMDMKDSIVVERATCRLHEALCLLKDGRPGDCVEACSDVLGDGVTVVFDPVPSDSDDETAPAGDLDAEDDAGSTKSDPLATTTTVKIIPPSASTSLEAAMIPPQIRARAHHRRAKARLALNDLDGALEDARSAAFMGDRNAVQLYGRLMREGSGMAGDASSALAGLGGLGAPDLTLPSLFGSPSEGNAGAGPSSNPFLEGIMQGMGSGSSGGNTNNPLMPSGAGSSDFSSSLLSSLLSSGDDSSGGGGSNPFGLMGQLLAPSSSGSSSKRSSKSGKKGKGTGGMDTLAKSVLTSLLKRVEDEPTQQMVCSYLQNTNTNQILQFASMAGIPLKEDSARKLVTLANGMTPLKISNSISKVKRGISIVKTVRKVLKVVDKYKGVIILVVLGWWIRSAIMQPYTVKGSKKKAKRLAQKAALGLLIAPSSSGRQSLALGNACGGVMKHVLSRLALSMGSGTSMMDGEEGISASKTGIEENLEQLQNQLLFIEALEERNKAQLGSFVDENDQWQSLEEEERILLSSKDSLIQNMEGLTEQLVMLFMGQKMIDG